MVFSDYDYSDYHKQISCWSKNKIIQSNLHVRPSSRKQPPPISDRQSKTPKLSHFCLIARKYSNTQKYGLFCSLWNVINSKQS